MSRVRESGLCDDQETPYWTGVNCITCGRFVGRDGYVEVEHFEMSREVASVSGECGRCYGSLAGAA